MRPAHIEIVANAKKETMFRNTSNVRRWMLYVLENQNPVASVNDLEYLRLHAGLSDIVLHANPIRIVGSVPVDKTSPWLPYDMEAISGYEYAVADSLRLAGNLAAELDKGDGL